jgi:hypothetical protein
MRNCARRHVQKIMSRRPILDAEQTSFPREDILVPPNLLAHTLSECN